MARTVSLFCMLLVAWAALSGHTETWLLAGGVVSAALVTYLARRLATVDDEGFPVHLAARAVRYLIWLLPEIIRANLHVAGVILAPSRVDPCLYHFQPSQRTDLGRVVQANSITITPGTVTVGMDDGVLTVHALTPTSRQGVETGEMDRQVSRLMGERR